MPYQSSDRDSRANLDAREAFCYPVAATQAKEMKEYLTEFIGTFFLVLTNGCAFLLRGAGVMPPLAIGDSLMRLFSRSNLWIYLVAELSAV
jgi:hypothetical protein